MDFALAEVEVDPVVGNDGTEPLRYSAEFESGSF
jgi:hypothetical protein